VTHALALQVVVPLLAAPLCVLLRGSLGPALVATAASLFGLVNAILLLLQVHAGGPVAYAFGGVPMPFGIEYRLDLLGAYVLVDVTAIVFVSTAWAARTRVFELGAARRDLFWAIWLTCTAGLSGITVTGDLFNVFVFLEIASLSTYVLVAYGSERRALVAAYRYLLMGTIGATFLLIGIGLLYAVTGTLNMADLARLLPTAGRPRAVATALAFISVGLCLKVAVFPLHLWLPGAYALAPSPVSALLAGTATKVAFYLWLRFFYTVHSPTAPFAGLPLDKVLLPLGLASALVGSVIAIFQVEPKRLLAWSSIAQIGYLVVGLSLGSAAGVAATLAHLCSHALVKTALFLALGAVVVRLAVLGRPLLLQDLRGLARRMPYTTAAIVVGGIGLVGMPLTSGFVSKWMLIEALLDRGLWSAVALLVLSSLLSLVYVGRLLEPLFAAPAAGQPLPPMAPPNRLATLLLWLPCLATLVLGVCTTFNVDIAQRAAELLLGVGR